MLRWVSLSDCQDDNYYCNYYYGWESLSDCQDDNYYYHGWVRLCVIVMMTIIMIISIDGSDCQDDNKVEKNYGFV